MTPILSPVLTFTTFMVLALKHSNTLGIATAFTSLSLLALLYKPLVIVMGALPLLASATACFSRIQTYLNKISWEDSRHRHLVSSPSKGNHVWSATPSTSDQIELLGMEKGDQDVVATLHGKFRRNKDVEHVLDIAEWKIRRQTFTVLLGPVGCGKSTALKSLLGESPGFEGSITVASQGVAFCDQTPWLPNGIFRDIILGNTDLDLTWYNTVISACALEEDLRQWPQGDQSTIGSKGTTLSGGQKQRMVGIHDIEFTNFWTNRCRRL